MCNLIVCGGFSKRPPKDDPTKFDNKKKSCLKFNEENGDWIELSLVLKKPRDNSLCWGLPTGEILLLGGHEENTEDVERVHRVGESWSSDIIWKLDKGHQHIE